MSFFDELQRTTSREREQLFAAPVIRSALNGDIARHQYLAFLAQAYHHVKHTVPLLMGCGSRLDAKHAWLRAATAEYIAEESGHEEWVLSDIAACGGDAQRVRDSGPHVSTEMMVAYAYHQIDRGNPVGFFGMVHVLEGTSAALAGSAAARIQGALGLPANAFSYLSSHGSLDVEHVDFFAGLMNRLDDAPDRAAVTYCSKRFYQLYGDIFRSLPTRAAPITEHSS